MKVTCKNNSVLIDGENILIEGYTFKGEIARGANGVVVGAIDNNLNRPVAIKLWFSKSSDFRDHLEQGKNEAIKVASIPHQNIVTVFNAGITGGCFYLVMELLPGQSLRELLTGRFPGLALRTNLWSQIVLALRHAHRNSVYHGDLHDRNVIVIDELVKIIDFGTSYFYTGDKVKDEEESSFIVKLCKNIFPEIEEELRKYAKEVTHNPRLTLFYCDTMVKLVSQLEILKSYTSKENGSEHLLLSQLFNVALNYAKCPYLHLENLVEKFNEFGLKKHYIERFLGQLSAYCILELSPDSKSSESTKTSVIEITDVEGVANLEKLRCDIKVLHEVVAEQGAIGIDTLLYS